MKRLLSLLLATILCFSLCTAAFADETEPAADRPLVICLDPGHGARDSGAVATYGGVQYEEADLVLKIALYLREELETYDGVQVLMTRTDRQGEMPTIDPNKIKPRTDYAVEHGADVVVSLHLNASENTDIRGAMILSSNGYFRPEVADVGNGLGTNIVLSLARLGLQNRGHLKTNSNEYRNPNGTVADYYAIVRNGIWQNIPSIIVEHCFLTNADDFKEFLSTDEKLQALAIADADGIAAYYGLQKADGTTLLLTDYRNHWAEPYINTAVGLGWVKGYPDRTFKPNNTLTRADFVTLLSRLSGEELPKVEKSPFPDFPATAYYAQSVAWAVDAGVINGFEDGTFRPDLPITREQMAHIMALYLQHKGLDTKYSGDGKNDAIADLDKVQGWAKDDVLFCYEVGLLNGRGANFVPQGNATRAEACTILCRLSDYLTQAAEPAETTEPEESPAPETPEKPELAPAPDAVPETEELPAAESEQAEPMDTEIVSAESVESAEEIIPD